MKKLAWMILILVYATVSSGMMLNFHYCMDRLVDVQMMEVSEACPVCGQKAQASHCCSDKAVQLKLSIDQTAHTFHVPTLAPAVMDLFPFGYEGMPIPGVRDLPHLFFVTDDPPGEGAVSLFVRYCTYLI